MYIECLEIFQEGKLIDIIYLPKNTDSKDILFKAVDLVKSVSEKDLYIFPFYTVRELDAKRRDNNFRTLLVTAHDETPPERTIWDKILGTYPLPETEAVITVYFVKKPLVEATEEVPVMDMQRDTVVKIADNSYMLTTISVVEEAGEITLMGPVISFDKFNTPVIYYCSSTYGITD